MNDYVGSDSGSGDVQIAYDSVAATKAQVIEAAKDANEKMNRLMKEVEDSNRAIGGRVGMAFRETHMQGNVHPFFQQMDQTLEEVGNRLGLTEKDYMTLEDEGSSAFTKADLA